MVMVFFLNMRPNHTLLSRLKQARTWLDNTEMLRTLGVSVLTPLAVGFSRPAVLFLQEGR